MEDMLKEMMKKQTISAFDRLRGIEKYKTNTLTAEELSDRSKTPAGLREFKGSKEFFLEVKLGAQKARDMVGEEAKERCDAMIKFADDTMKRIGETELGTEDEVEKAHEFIDYILAQLRGK